MKYISKLLLICLFIIVMTGCKEKYTRIVVISDLHYLSDSLYNDSPYFGELIKKADAKITPYSKELLDSLIADIDNEKADVVVLLGDMSFNGERISHEEISEAFKKLDLPVLAIPGNHDLYNLYAREYNDNGYTGTDTVGISDFEDIYNSPYTVKDNDSSSFIYRINNINLLLLDVNASKVFDEVSGSTLSWIKDNIDKNDVTVAFSHQNLLVHGLYSEDYLIHNCDDVLSLYNELNIKVNFTGHIHLQNIVEENGFTEVATSAVSVSPLQYGVIDVYSDHLEYHTEQLKNDELQNIATEYFNSKSERSISRYTDDEELISYYISCNSLFFKGRKDELVYDREKVETISKLSSFTGNYLDIMFSMEKVNDNYLSILLD
ncbi:MAG: metallophosphoesterase family protein [Erysipelotrichaceae bacterium]